jgi:hypothetical protein
MMEMIGFYPEEPGGMPASVRDKIEDLAWGYASYVFGHDPYTWGVLRIYPFEGKAWLEVTGWTEEDIEVDVPSAALPEDLRKLLLRAGVSETKVAFDGRGGDGYTIADAIGTFDDTANVPRKGEGPRRIEQVVVDFLRSGVLNHYDWRSGAGGHGTVTIRPRPKGRLDDEGHGPEVTVEAYRREGECESRPGFYWVFRKLNRKSRRRWPTGSGRSGSSAG